MAGTCFRRQAGRRHRKRGAGSSLPESGALHLCWKSPSGGDGRRTASRAGRVPQRRSCSASGVWIDALCNCLPAPI